MFITYYKNYLGINKNDNVVSCEQRKIPLNKQFYYSVIGTSYKDKVIYSVLPEWKDLFEEHLKASDSSIDYVMSSFNQKHNLNHELRQMYRMSYNGNRLTDNPAVIFTESLIHEVYKERSDQIDLILHRNKESIKNKNKFAIVIDGKLASMAKISDIDHGGGNIAVYTSPEFRNNGYGKFVVDSCIGWCIENHIVPIYLVEANNTFSVKLAKSLGFEIESIEWILSKECRD